MSFESGVISDVRNVATGSEVDFKRRYRVQGALSILGLWDAKPSKPGHAETCDRDLKRLLFVSFMHRDRVACTCGADRERYKFPEWVTERSSWPRSQPRTPSRRRAVPTISGKPVGFTKRRCERVVAS